MAETKKFSVHPAMIYSLITAQAGTLGKAVLENVMNSIDALATKVTIEITRNGIKIVDDGHGFRSKEEIEECFAVFGFPHEEGSRIYGQFGIGRAQLWSFSSAVWKTNNFKMVVDIKNRGLDYDLFDKEKQVQGLTIESKFYSPMSTLDIQSFKQELKELARFAQIPVILDGEQINADPASMKWDFVTDDAYIKLADKNYLEVYNLGVLVKRFSAYHVGTGGLVVTRPGVKLALNMARNDILVSECKVWKRIKPFIQKKSDEKVAIKKTRMGAEEINNRVTRFLSGELKYKDVADMKMITDITDRRHTLYSFMSTQVRGPNNTVVVTTAPEGSILGDRAHTSKAAFVVHPSTFGMFGVDSLAELKAVLYAAFGKPAADDFGDLWWASQFFAKANFEPNLSAAVPSLREGHALVPVNEYTKQERAALAALERASFNVRRLVLDSDESSDEGEFVGADDEDDYVGNVYWQQRKTLNANLPQREVSVGLSQSAAAWTDGKTSIVFNRATLKNANVGYGGWVHLLSILAHEYLHNDSSIGTHLHDEHFYRRFHEVHNSPMLGTLAFDAYRLYVEQLLKANIKPTYTMLKALTYAEKVDSFFDNFTGQSGAEKRLAPDATTADVVTQESADPEPEKLAA